MKFFFALLGVALAAHSSLPLVRPLPVEQEYRFRYEATLASGIPLQSTDAALTRIRAEVVLQYPSERIGLLRLHKIEIVSDKDVQSTDFESLEKRVLSEEQMSLLELPVRFHHKDAMVSYLQFAPGEQPWSANIKRAVVNMLQVNMKVNPEQENVESNYFVDTEKTIEGVCEVAYTLVSEQGKTSVTKSVNFDKCERRWDVAFNQRFVANCAECDYKMIVPQTVYNYQYEKQQLKWIEVRSTYTVSLKEQPLMKTETFSRLTLLETSDIRRPMDAPKGEKVDLIYSNELERSMEEYFMKGEEAEQKPFENIPKKVEMIDEIVSRIAELKENTPESVHMFARLVRVLRMCSQEEMLKLHKMSEKKYEQKENTIIEHALAVAGTKITIEHLLTLDMKLMTPLKAAQLLKSIQETPYPSEQIADLLFKFSKTELCRNEPIIRQSVWLAYGAVVRGVVIPTQEKALSRVPEHLKEKYVSILKTQWEQSETIYEKILALKTFANAGIDISIAQLEKILLDKKQPTVIRMEVIDAMRLLSEQMPRKIVKVLMLIYNNRLEKNEVRMAALNQLMQAKPTKTELYQVVQRMEREPNHQVAAFTYHMLTSLAKSKLPSHNTLSLSLTPLLRQSMFRPEQRFLSVYQHWPVFSEESFSGMNVNFGAIFGKDSAIPKDIMTSLETVFGGNWDKYLAQLGFSHQNVELIFNKVLSKLNLLEKERKNIIRASRVSHSLSLLKDLAKKLNIRVRETVSEEAHAMLYLRYKQMDYAMFPINEQIVDELIEKYIRDGSVDMKVVERLFQKDSEFEFTHAGFFYESVMKMPTTLGLPLTISSKLPTIFSANGRISFEKISYGVRARLQAQPTLASTHVHVMNMWIPVFEHGVKIVRSAQIATPIDILAEITLKKNFDIVFRQYMPEQKKTLLRIESRPVAFIRYFNKNSELYAETEEKTIALPKVEKISEERSLKTEYAGLEFVLSGNNYRQWTLENVLLGEQQIELTVRPTSRVPKDIKITMTVEPLTKSHIEGPQTEKMLLKKVNLEEGEWEQTSESSRREYLQHIVRAMELTSAYKHRIYFTFRTIEKSMVELRAECEGKLNFCRISTEIRIPTVERRNWKLKSLLEVVLPRPVSSVQELKEQKHREVQLYTQTIWGSEEENKIEVTAQLEQSEEQRKIVHEPKALRGLPAYDMLKRIARLNQLKAVAKYELSPISQTSFERLYSVIKSYSLWNSRIEMVENQPSLVVVKYTVDPIAPSQSELTIQTPQEALRIENIRLPMVLPTIARMPKNVVRHTMIEKSECTIENNKVYTFDDVIFRAPLRTCYTVVAKDCTEEPRYAVLMKSLTQNGEEKKVKIIFKEKEYELEVIDGQLKAYINGERISEEKFEEHNIEKLGDELFVVDFEDLVVRFDGYSAKVLLGNTEMNKQCGLCGHFDGEKKNEYRTASNEETEDIEEFHRSYIVKSAECSLETPLKKAYKQYNKESSSEEYSEKESKKNMLRKTIPSSEEYEEVKGRKTEEASEPEMNVRVQEFAHRVCFSLEAVPECPKDLTNGNPVEKKIRFGCLPRHDSTARRILAAIRRGEDVERGEYLNDLKLSFVDNILVPQTCMA